MNRIIQTSSTTINWLFSDFESRTDKWARTSGAGAISFPSVAGYGNVLRIVSPGSGDVEVHRNFTPSYGSNCFKGFTSIDLDIDLHGATISGGDASAFGFDQNGWKYVSLSDYVINGQDGMQSISIPIADLVTAGLDEDALASFLIIRFWHNDVITIDIDNITFVGKSASSFSQPELPNKKSYKSEWNIQSTDTMKWSKDTMAGQKTKEEIYKLIHIDKKLGVSHITVDCPYDNYSDYSPAIEPGYKEKWLNAIRDNGLKVWHRQHFNEWEGDYSFQKITPRTTPSRALGNVADVLNGTDTSSWLYLHYNYIKTHSSDFEEGDIFTPIAEVENAGYGGATTDQFLNAMEMWEFIRNLQTVCNRAFAEIGLEDKVFIGLWGHSGYTVMNKIDEFTIDCEGYLAIDHYEFSPATMSSDLDTIINFFDVPIIIGEWGNYQESDRTLNAQNLTDIFNVFIEKEDYIVGVNYWDDIGGAHESLINDDYSVKENYNSLWRIYGGDIVVSINDTIKKRTFKKVGIKQNQLMPINLRDIRNGLVLDYNFAEKGSTVIDQSQNGNNGTIVGATRVQGYGDLRGIKGDGVDDRVTFGTLGIFNGTQDFSLVSVFKLDNFPSSMARLVNLMGENNLLFTLGDYVDVNILHIRLAQGAWRNGVQTPVLELNKWYIVQVTYNTTNGWKMYMDGQLIDTDATTGAIGVVNNTPNSILADNNGYNAVNGILSIVRIYNKALTPTQIRNQYLFFKKRAGII